MVVFVLRYFIGTYIHSNQQAHSTSHITHSSNSHSIHSHEEEGKEEKKMARKKGKKKKEKQSDESLEGEITWVETVT
jgi:hypothetical protein